eukprot:TRINITY_DN7132_c0_g1_i1.p1 TRINITY_DN7132_c0_g1~~TRINITY_DN7132_c0_g1_i1.p1  ORF type:complete len:190 (-),score=57.77 TRINITY_DN7132_c0_g1_i1:152-721(-)
MSGLMLRLMGNPILRKEAAKLTKEEILKPETYNFVTKLINAMEIFDGTGIAAPQVGVSKQIFIAKVENVPDVENMTTTCFINPELSFPEPEDEFDSYEMCLSVPNLVGRVKRKKKMVMKYLDLNANEREIECNGYISSVLQHESDHLFGYLYVDKIKDIKKDLSFVEEFDFSKLHYEPGTYKITDVKQQ